ncbi:hypothetical protein VP01_1509g3, partial [Puccinia sorghi]
DILAYLILFKFPNSLHHLKRKIMHSDKTLKVDFVCNHLTQYNNESKAKTRDASTSEAALYSGKNEKFNCTMRSSKSGQNTDSNSNKKGSRCTDVYHNPKQYQNHSSDSCWHLHTDKAPDWWRESHEKWKNGNKNKSHISIQSRPGRKIRLYQLEVWAKSLSTGKIHVSLSRTVCSFRCGNPVLVYHEFLCSSLVSCLVLEFHHSSTQLVLVSQYQLVLVILV